MEEENKEELNQEHFENELTKDLDNILEAIPTEDRH